MSHIFDALQRAEEERRGGRASSRAAATELLECAERETQLHWKSDAPVATIADTMRAAEASRPMAARTPRQNASRTETEDVNLLPAAIQTLHLKTPFHTRLAALADQGGPAAEAFRLFGVRLRHLRRERSLTKLLVTSTTPQEGKSVIAGNLACTLAATSQQRVLLLEGDVRRPSQGELFRLDALPGLCEYFSGHRTLAESIYRLEEAGLWFIPAGRAPGNSPELIDSLKLTSMAAQLSQWFDWIIIDSPPVLPLADTSVWEKMADGVLLVARRGISMKRKLKQGTEAIDHKKLIGMVLNSSTRATDEDYYYYRRPSPDSDSNAVR